MSIETVVTVHETVPEKPYYPRVMVNIREGEEGCKGVVVLFTAETEGTVLWAGKHAHTKGLSVGHHTKFWVACTYSHFWQPCNITLITET